MNRTAVALGWCGVFLAATCCLGDELGADTAPQVAEKRTLLSGWATVTGGKQGGVEYKPTSAWPDGNPDFRGRGLFKVAVELYEVREQGEPKRFLKLQWHPVIRPAGEPATYPYRWTVGKDAGRRKNVAVDDPGLRFEKEASITHLAPIELDRGRTAGRHVYRALAHVDGKPWQIVICDRRDSRFKPGIVAQLDSNKRGGGMWSERIATIHDATFDLDALREAPHAVRYRWVPAGRLTDEDRRIIAAVEAAYAGGELRKDAEEEKHIARPRDEEFMAQGERDRFERNLARLDQYFPSEHEFLGREVVTNARGEIIATIAVREFDDPATEGSRFASILKRVDPADQRRVSYVELSRGWRD